MRENLDGILEKIGARSHHIISNGIVLSDEEYASGGGGGLLSRHHYREGDVVTVKDLSGQKMIRAIHAHGGRVEDHVVGDHVPHGLPDVPVYWEKASDKPK